MMRHVRRPYVIVLVLAVLAVALVNFGVFAHENRDVRFSHRLVTPAPFCDPFDPGASGSATPVAGATPGAADAPPALAEGEFRIEAVAARRIDAAQGLSEPLRLYTIVIPASEPLPALVGQPTCNPGYSIIYVESGELELTHHASLSGTPTVEEAGAVSYSASPTTTPQWLPAGSSPVILKAGDSAYIEHAIISYRPVGTFDVRLLVASVTPEWLPCHGSPC